MIGTTPVDWEDRFLELKEGIEDLVLDQKMSLCKEDEYCETCEILRPFIFGLERVLNRG